MKRTLLTVLIIVMMCGVAFGRGFEPKNYRWNIEPGYFGVFGARDIKGFNEQEFGVGLSLETRYRFNIGMELGLYASVSDFYRNYEYLSYENFRILNRTQFFSMNVMPTLAYNHRVSRFVELFGGAGIGWMWCDRDKNAMGDDGIPRHDCSSNSLVFMPRVGVKVRNHLRFSVGYKWQEKANSHAFIAVGWTFGVGKID